MARPSTTETPATRTRPIDRWGLRSAWLWYLAAGLGVVAASLPAHPVEGQPVVAGAALAALMIGIRWRRPRPRTPWVVIMAAQVVVVAALLAWTTVYLVTGHQAPYPTWIDPIYLSSYPVLATGLAFLVRRRPGHSPWEGVLDASLLTLGVATVLWVAVFVPNLNAGMPRWTLVTALSYPSMDVLLLAILAWLVFAIGVRTPSILLLVGSFVLLLGTDVIQAYLAAHGGDANGNRLTLAGWDISYALLGAAALHPSLARTIDPAQAPAAIASRGRVALYLGVAVACPTSVLVSSLLSEGTPNHIKNEMIPLIATAAVAVLLVIRLTQMARLASDRAATLDQQAAALERSQHDLRRAHQRMTAIFQSAPTGMAQVRPDGELMAVNPALARFTGQRPDELVGHGLRRLVHPDDLTDILAALQDTVREDRQRTVQARTIDAHGDTRWADWVFSALRTPDSAITAMAVIADRTDARRLEIELRHAQKLEAIGRLAAGVAHEINTPIQFIGDNVDFVGNAATQLLATVRSSDSAGSGQAPTTTRLGADELDYLAQEIPEAVRQTKDGVHRVATIVAALKSFAHRDAPTHQPADINRALTDTITVARNELRDIAAVRTDLGPLPPVSCSIGDLNQVFLNLLINAADAVAANPTPAAANEITVRTRHRDHDVVIEISDTGVGIPGDLMDKIFEPFFTTKPVGRGTGQGLALARAVVVDGHQGALEVTSSPGAGTTFTIRIPLHSAAVPAPAATPEASHP